MKHRPFALALAAGALLAGAATPARAAETTKIATIDMQRAVSETNEGARVIDELKKLSDKRMGELDTKRNQLGKEKTDFEKRCQGKLGNEACARGAEDLQRKFVELQNLQFEYQNELQKRQSDRQQPVVTKMLAVVRRLAQKDGFDVVVDRAVVHYRRDEIDLTDAAIKLFNSESSAQPLPAPKPGAAPKAPGAGGATAPPAPPATNPPPKK
ncbi:MAG TPA: OmpH family outer membrane protein [Polyangiaceae bacterium]|nr:OmpH family outer membrane protein [Polyangiaceae bacterium]